MLWALRCISYRYCFEHVEPIQRRANHSTRDLRMPMNLFHVLLALVHEEQLRWYVPAARGRPSHCTRLLIVLLDRKVPKCDLIVRARCSEDGVVCGVPLDRGNWRPMPSK